MKGVRNNPSDERRIVLELDACLLAPSDVAEDNVSVDMRIRAGELVLLDAEDEFSERALVDGICGLLSPVSGRVSFLDHDWQSLSPDWSNAQRGRIGIVERTGHWLPHLSLAEGMVLSQLHHTRNPRDAIYREAAALARRFGLPGLPADLPEQATAFDRHCANLVRAFVGRPMLVLIERQREAIAGRQLAALVREIREVRERDGAVLWFIGANAREIDDSVPASRRLRLSDGPPAMAESMQ